MVYNALAGACAAIELGLTKEEIKKGVSSVRTIAGRTNLIETDSLLVIDDCYNANPVSMMGSLDILSTAKGRTVAILGDMFELGTNEKQMHFDTGVHAAKKNIDLICCIGELSKNTYDGAKSIDHSGMVLYFRTKQDFIDQMNELIKKDDTVLVKASHGLEFPEIVELLKEFK